MRTLPKIPSKLIRLALKDLEVIEKDPRYTVNMDVWHLPLNTTCVVCMAGAVMAKTLQIALRDFTDPEDFADDDQNCLRAIDRFRVGHLERALYYLDLDPTPFKSSVHVTSYYESASQFKSDMADMADQFERAGL